MELFMKKLFIVLMLLAVSGVAAQKSFAQSALDQLQQASDDGQEAVNSNSDEGARAGASMNFDTESTTPPVVDLSESQTLTPSLLREPGE